MGSVSFSSVYCIVASKMHAVLCKCQPCGCVNADLRLSASLRYNKTPHYQSYYSCGRFYRQLHNQLHPLDPAVIIMLCSVFELITFYCQGSALLAAGCTEVQVRHFLLH